MHNKKSTYRGIEQCCIVLKILQWTCNGALIIVRGHWFEADITQCDIRSSLFVERGNIGHAELEIQYLVDKKIDNIIYLY